MKLLTNFNCPFIARQNEYKIIIIFETINKFIWDFYFGFRSNLQMWCCNKFFFLISRVSLRLLRTSSTSSAIKLSLRGVVKVKLITMLGNVWFSKTRTSTIHQNIVWLYASATETLHVKLHTLELKEITSAVWHIRMNCRSTVLRYELITSMFLTFCFRPFCVLVWRTSN